MKFVVLFVLFALMSACSSEPEYRDYNAINAEVYNKWWTEDEDGDRSWYIDIREIFEEEAPEYTVLVGTEDESPVWNLIETEQEREYYIVFSENVETEEFEMQRMHYTDATHQSDLEDKRVE
ncbi:hypothetical protein ACFO4L_11255 [Bacillus daqingensis]|uniref:Uncharacterized protein n=1 Tax=Bacillus daqingensis TaxID=872396 RepID=A0ABV9NWA1_9BACI